MGNAVFGQVVTAIVTPFDAQGRVDEAAVVRLVEHLLTNGSEGLVVCGTTGESPTLTHEEKLHLFRLVKETARGRATVIAGTSGNDTASSITMSREAAEIGVDGLLLVVPPYNKPPQEGLYQHFKAIAESVPKTPCMLYNIPGRSSQNMEVATTLRLAADVENIVAIKEASGNLMSCAEIACSAPRGFAVYSGDDGLTLPMLAVGGVGVVSVTSHFVGKDVKAMHAAFFAGRHEEAACLNGRMLPLVRACFQPTSSSPAPLKAGLEMIGVPVGGVRLPLVKANERERGVMRSALAEYGVL